MAGTKYNPKELSILVVEDHAIMRKSYDKIIKSLGFENIETATNGKDAILLLKKRQIDFVLLDLYLPKISGFSVLEYIRKQETNWDLPVIVISGDASKEDIVKVSELGCSDYMVKPFQAKELEKKIEIILNNFLSPSDQLRLIRVAERNFLDDKIEMAENIVDEALEIDPDSPRANHLKALILDKKGLTENAIELLNRNSNLNPSFLKNYTTLANISIRKKEYPTAILALKNELDINPKHPSRQTLLGNLLKNQGLYDKAISHYRKALIEDSTLIGALMGMGDCFSALENYSKAVYYFKRLRKNHPEDVKSLYKVVSNSLKLKKGKLAENYLKTEIKNNPEKKDLYIVLAKFYSKTEEKAEAQKIVRTAITLFPGDKGILETAGVVSIHFKDTSSGIRAYQQLIKIEKKPEHFFQLYQLYNLEKNYSQAILVLHNYIVLKKEISLPSKSQIFFLYAHNKNPIKAFFVAKSIEKSLNSAPLPKEIAQLMINIRRNIANKRRYTSPTKAS